MRLITGGRRGTKEVQSQTSRKQKTFKIKQEIPNYKLKRHHRRGHVEESKQKSIRASLCWSEDLLLWYIVSKHAFLIRKPLLLSLIRQEQIVLS